MNLYGLFILDVNIKYMVFSILYRHINVPMACKELRFISPRETYAMCSCILGCCVRPGRVPGKSRFVNKLG